MTTATIDATYALPDTSQQRYPALQVNEYEPRNLNAKLSICLSEQSVELLSQDALNLLDPQPITASFKDGDTTLFALSNIDCVVIGVSPTFLYNKKINRYQPNRGEEVGGDIVTARKVFLALMVGDRFAITEDGTPQVFTLNLKSLATDFVKPSKPQQGDGSICSLNVALCKHYKIRGSLTHLVKVPLLAAPTERVSKTNPGNSKFAVKYSLGNKAEPLSKEQQKIMFDLAQDPEIKDAIANPYRVDSTTPEAAPPDEFYQEREMVF